MSVDVVDKRPNKAEEPNTSGATCLTHIPLVSHQYIDTTGGSIELELLVTTASLSEGEVAVQPGDPGVIPFGGLSRQGSLYRLHFQGALRIETGRLTISRTIPPPADAVKNGIANGASCGPNHSSNMGMSSPARRWKIPRGQPLAATNATPSPTRTPTESRNHRSRLRVRAHNQR